VGACAQTLEIKEPVFEFGARILPGQRPDDVNLRPLFPGKRYYGADIDAGDGVDYILDLQAIDLPSESVGTLIAVETFEHVRKPWVAMDEIYRVLKPEGIVILSSTMHFRIHHEPDYWRYTPAAFEVLLEQFPNRWVDWAGDPQFPHTVVGIGFKGRIRGNLNQLKKTVTGDSRILWKREPGSACNI